MEFTVNDKTYTLNDAEEALFYDDDFSLGSNGIDTGTRQKLFAKAKDNHVLLSKTTVMQMYKLQHKLREDDKKPEKKMKKFFKNYKTVGMLQELPKDIQDNKKQELIDEFSSSEKFHGRVPRMIDSITRVYTAYPQLKKEDFISFFSVNKVRGMLDKNISECEAVILYMNYNEDKLNAIIQNPITAYPVCRMISSFYQTGNEEFKKAADWIMAHTRTNESFLLHLMKKMPDITINPEDTVEMVENKLGNLKAQAEIKRIEKAYKEAGFKFKNCACELKDVEKMTESGNYLAYILNGQDERQVMLGYDTHCCQKLGDAGESAMMHGLLNPKAGFWVIEEKGTGTIKAQAEVWEENADTLVFDNIEYANDCDISLYREVISKWLEDTEYRNVKMGTGYNALMHETSFRNAGEVKPSITPYEAYVLSYEDDSYCEGDAAEISSVRKAEKLLEEGKITYFDYIYCDSENRSVWLKENGQLEPYFTNRQAEITERQTEEEENFYTDETI